ncbi:MAG: hypothetical protein LIP12_00355 [Clostridiales bacterium]|nr:hypothetical protein [Clostridiales bacterium]
MFKFTPYWSGREEERLFLEKIASQTIADGLRHVFARSSDSFQKEETKTDSEIERTDDPDMFWKLTRPYFSDDFFDNTARFFDMGNDIDAGNWFINKKYTRMIEKLEDTGNEYEFDLFEKLLFRTAIRYANDDVVSGFAMANKYFNNSRYKEVLETLKGKYDYADDDAQELADAVCRFDRMLPDMDEEENFFFWDDDEVFFFKDGFYSGIYHIKGYAGERLDYGYKHAIQIFEDAGIEPPVLLLGTEEENAKINAIEKDRFLSRMNQLFPAKHIQKDIGSDSGKAECEKETESLPLTEAQIREVDANNRKAKAIMECIVHSVYLSDEDEIDVPELVLAAYDYVVRNDALLGSGVSALPQ